MRVIDLLVKIANGEEVPEYINYKNRLNFKKDIILVTKENIIYILDKGQIELTDVVEIPKEYKKIEKLDLKYYHDEPAIIDDMAYKINEIIEKINNKKLD